MRSKAYERSQNLIRQPMNCSDTGRSLQADGLDAKAMRQAVGLHRRCGAFSQGVALGWYEPGLRPGYLGLA